MPFHSPLLEQSQLLSFPPLSDMLKLSGSLLAQQVTANHSGVVPLQGPLLRPWTGA